MAEEAKQMKQRRNERVQPWRNLLKRSGEKRLPEEDPAVIVQEPDKKK